MKNLEKLEIFIENLKKSVHAYARVEADSCIEYLRSDDPTIPVPPIQNYWVITGFEQLLGNVDEWDEWEEKIMALMTQPSNWNEPQALGFSTYGGFRDFTDWVSKQILRSKNNLDITKILQLASRFITDEAFLIYFLNTKTFFVDGNQNLTKWGNYLLLNNQHYNPILLNTSIEANEKTLLVMFLLSSKQNEFLSSTIDSLIVDDNILNITDLLLNEDSTKYEPLIFTKWQNLKNSYIFIKLYEFLANKFPEKYTPLELEAIQKTLTIELNWCSTNYASLYCYGPEPITVLAHCFNFLIKKETQETKKRFQSELQNIHSIPVDLLVAIANELKEDGLDILIEALHQDPNNLYWNDKDFFKKYFKIVEALDFRSHQEYFWDLSKNKSKELRRLGAGLLSKLGNEAIPNASELTKSKKLEARQMGFLILSLINTDESKVILVELLEQEKNDEARDIILESLRHLVSKQNSLAEINTKIAFAQKRAKLNAPLTPWLDERVLPPLYLKDGTQLSVEAFRFLHIV